MSSPIIPFILTFNTILILASSWPQWPPQNVVDAFHKCIDYRTRIRSSDFYAPNDSNFNLVLNSTAQNLRCLLPSKPKPLLIFKPSTESQIQAAVICAQWYSLNLRIRSGGHDYEGLSYTTAKGGASQPFMVLDLLNFKQININTNDNTAWVQAGVTTGQFYHAISKVSRNLAFPAGLCTSLGIGGHITGGAYGAMMRKYGLGADNAIDVKIVDARGNVLTRQTMSDDFFWAIRGVGGASLGVIVAWKLKLVHVPNNVTVFSVSKTLETNATDILHKWQKAASKIDDRLFIRVIMFPIPGTVMNVYQALFLGDKKSLLGVMNNSFSELGLKPKDCIEMSWIESVLFIAQYPVGTTPDILDAGKPTFLYAFKAKSDFVRNPITKEGLEGMWKVLMGDGVAPLMILNPFGGKMDQLAENALPFPHRKNVLFMIQYVSNWLVPATESAHMNWMRNMYDYMADHVSNNPREAYVNYRDLDIGEHVDRYGSKVSCPMDWGPKYYKDNFWRLVQIKTWVDPFNFFNHEQSIPTYWSMHQCTKIDD